MTTDDESEAFTRGVKSSRKFVEAVKLRQWERKASEKGVSYAGNGVLDLYDAALEIVEELAKGKLVQSRRLADKAVDDAGLVFEVDGDVVYVVRDGFRYGMIQSQGTDVSIRDSRWSKAELLAIAERMK